MSTLLIMLLKNALPYLVAGIAGFGLAFGIQELRLTRVEQQFAQYKIDQEVIIQHQIDQAVIQRKKAYDDFLQSKAILQKEIEAGETFRRCVAAGKCGRVQRDMPACPSTSISPAGNSNAIGSDTVPVVTGDAAINECAQTTLMLNKLQADIEAQPGYIQ